MSESSLQEARDILAELAGAGVHRLRRDFVGSPWESVGGGMTDREEELLVRLSGLADSGLADATELTLDDEGVVRHAAAVPNSGDPEAPPPDGSGTVGPTTMN